MVHSKIGPMPAAPTSKYHRLRLLVCLAVVTIVGFFTYVRNYDQPPSIFWDENYHIASAQRYLNRVYFLEPHPPLGKLMIALGEYILSPNEKTDQFLDVEYGPGERLPPGFSFAGYRLFPTLFGWLVAPILFLIVTTITGRVAFGLLVSGLYLFDNAIIVHSRGAMLEGCQLFFQALALLAFTVLAKRSLSRRNTLLLSVACGAALGATMCTKVTSIILLPLIPGLLFLRDIPVRLRVAALAATVASFSVVYFGIWRIHFQLGERRIEALADSGYFSTDPEVRALIDANKHTTLGAFPRMWRENALEFFPRYQRGVPLLDLSSGTDNGSPALFWPIGARTISYRWELAENHSVKYLYLVSNPFSWFLALGAVALSGSLLIAQALFSSAVRLKNAPFLLSLLVMYCGYLLAMSEISRVMYLYHYFAGLLFAYILVGLVVNEVERIGPFEFTDRRKSWFVLFCILTAFVTFRWYSPLTYYQPITDAQIRNRALLPLWDLVCSGCPTTNKLVKPADPVVLSSRFTISELAPESIHQDWGQPRIGISVIGRALVVQGVSYEDAFGMHSNSTIDYSVDEQFSRFAADVGLPDYMKDSTASVLFEVLGDERVLWSSGILKPGEPLKHIDVDISAVKKLHLIMKDAGDGITEDHGFWANLKLTRKPIGVAPHQAPPQ